MLKSLWPNSTPIPNQNTHENRNGWIHPEHKHTRLNSKANAKDSPAWVRNKARMPTFHYQVDATGGVSQCN